VARTRALDHGIDEAWADVRRARESGRLNVRRQAARRVRDSADLGAALVGLEQAVADTCSMARTIEQGLPAADGYGGSRPVQGALLVNLRNNLEAMAPVAAAQPVRVRSRHDLARTSRYR
jgi:hypothetical protein